MFDQISKLRRLADPASNDLIAIVDVSDGSGLPAGETLKGVHLSSISALFRSEEAQAQLTLTDAATINWDLSAGAVAKVTLGANRTMAAPANIQNGATYILEVIQGPGSNTITWNSVFVWPGGVAPTLTATAGKRDFITFIASNGGKLHGSAVVNFA